MKQFYALWYGSAIITQILAPVQTTEREARVIMMENIKKFPCLTPEEMNPGEAETIIKGWGTIKTYPIPS